MEKTNYPDLGLHRAQHREFVEKVEQFRRDVEAHKIVAPGAVMDFLSNWLTNHIKGTDRRYSAHLNANGVR